MKPKTNTDPMEEAYKSLDAKPSATGVSEAAQGLTPKNDDEAFRDNTEALNARRFGEEDTDHGDDPEACIHDAYVNLFQSIADILRSK